MGIADTIESMVSYKNRKRNRKANITMIKNAKKRLKNLKVFNLFRD